LAEQNHRLVLLAPLVLLTQAWCLLVFPLLEQLVRLQVYRMCLLQ
jgi:hypothetical protein